jgi:hypothetical protein
MPPTSIATMTMKKTTIGRAKPRALLSRTALNRALLNRAVLNRAVLRSGP